MRVRQTSKHDVATRMHERYLKAKTKAEKAKLLDEMVELTGYHRGHAQRLLWSASHPSPRDCIGGNGLDLRQAPGAGPAPTDTRPGGGGCIRKPFYSMTTSCGLNCSW